MRKSLNVVFDAMGYLAGAFIFAIFVLMIVASIGRMVGWHVSSINDIVAWFCAASAFLAMAHAFKNGDFVRVTLLLEKVSPATRRVLEITSLSFAAVSMCYLACWAIVFTWESYEFQDMATGMVALPMWIPQMSFVIGAVLFALAVVDELILVLRGETPTYTRRVAERHAQGDFSSDI